MTGSPEQVAEYVAPYDIEGRDGDRVEYGIMLDCDKEGCAKKIGHRHADHGYVTGRHPSRAQVEQYKVDGRWIINNHAATLVSRTLPPWEPVALNDGGDQHE